MPHQTGRSAEAGKINQFDDWPVLHMGEHSTSSAPRSTCPDFDVDAQRLTNNIVDAQDVHFRQADQQLAHARRIRLHRGSSVL
jgi:hypothetical protein